MAGQRRGRPLHTAPPKKGKKRTYGKLELKPPDFAIPESHSFVIKIPLPHPLFITPPVIWPSLFALDSNRRPVITPPAAGLLCIVLITGGTLDTTHPYRSTPGDDIFKGQKFITGVCFHPCYTVVGQLTTSRRLIVGQLSANQQLPGSR